MSTIGRALASMALVTACATPAPAPRAGAAPPAAACNDTPAAGSPGQFQNPTGAKIDTPETCEGGTYIRVYGAGTRQLLMGQEGKPRGCSEPAPAGASEDQCREVFADAFGRAVIARLANAGVQATGLGLGACGKIQGGFDEWRYSVSINDWGAADATVSAVQAELDRWGLGHHFGVTVREIPCAIPLAESSPP